MNSCLEKEYIAFEEKLGFYAGRLISHPLIPPEHVYFSLTNRCNLRCKMCNIPKDSSRAEDELTISEVKNIILQIKDIGIKHLIFSGGEPFLRKDLIEIVEFAITQKIKMVDIITNGVLFNDYIIERLIKARLNHITISLDGFKNTNDEIRGKGVFDQAENKIDRLNYYKAKYNSSLPTLGINFTIMDNNIDSILPMIEFARSKKCNIIVFQPVLFNNTKMYEKRGDILWPSENSVLKLKDSLKKVVNLKDTLKDLCIYTDTSILEVIPDYFKGKRPRGNFKCYEGIKRIVITFDGKIWSCVGIYGDLRKNSLRRIWLSKEAAEIRKKVKKCKAHCLQDCVYFPSDIAEGIKKFLGKLEQKMDEESEEIKDKLLGKIEYYTNILSVKEKPSLLNFSERFNINKEINNLHAIKRKIIKLK